MDAREIEDLERNEVKDGRRRVRGQGGGGRGRRGRGRWQSARHFV